MMAGDPKMAQYVLRRMLNPDPARRACMRDVLVFFDSQQRGDGVDEQQAQRTFGALARANGMKRDALHALTMALDAHANGVEDAPADRLEAALPASQIPDFGSYCVIS